ncbi:hypothetical protein T492DRAFT_831717 [Pavlovales sp. CCMP2436]|nr:hypothetical protein T492DRAFT_831717 [Pavlovales sp. CCMP2436]
MDAPPLPSLMQCSSALMDAAQSGNLPEVRKQLDNGADVNGGPSFSSLLIYASESGHIPIVQFLLGASSDVDIVVDRVFYVLSSAIAFGHTGVVAVLLDSGASQDGLVID